MKDRSLVLTILPILVAGLFTTLLVAISQGQERPAEYTPDVSFTLETGLAEGKLVFIGVGGEIDGIVNPDLKVPAGAVVQVTLVNGDGVEHDIAFPDFGAESDKIYAKGSSTVVVFRADQEGTLVSLHRSRPPRSRHVRPVDRRRRHRGKI